MENTPNPQILEIPIDKLKESPYQGRLLSINGENTETTEVLLAELASSIQQSGLMQPISVRNLGDNFEIIDGHRRVVAFKNLGRTTIPAILHNCDDRNAQVLSIVGNLQRKNLKPLELARAYRKALLSGLFQTQRELSLSLGKNESFVGEILNTLRMDSRILKDLDGDSGISDIRMLRAIRRSGIINDQGISDLQWKLYTRVKEEGLSRDEVLKMAKKQKRSPQGNFALVIKKRKVTVEFRIDPTTANAKEFGRFLENKLGSFIEQFSLKKDDSPVEGKLQCDLFG